MSDNVFADLGFDAGDAGEHSLRVRLAVELKRYIQSNRLRQEDAATLFKVPQPTISRITRLNLANISLSLLLRMVMRAQLAFNLASEGTADTMHVSVGEKSTATFKIEILTLSPKAHTAEPRHPWIVDPSNVSITSGAEAGRPMQLN